MATKRGDQKKAQKSKEKTIKFKYVFEDDFNPKYINGGICSLSPMGEITINFYHERHAVPRSEYFLLTDDNMVGESVEGADQIPTTVIRYMQCGVTMGLGQAKAIREILDNTITKLEGSMKKQVDINNDND
ncbi:MAG: hypothetical protein R8J85_08960 [Mariprofundales bacterium]